MNNFEIKDGFGYNYKVMNNLTDSQKAKLYEAIALDTLNITRQMKDQRRGPVISRISVNYNRVNKADFAASAEINEEEVSVAVKAEIAIGDSIHYEQEKNTGELYQNVIFSVTQDCINTLKVLEEIGYGEYTTLTMPENMQAVVYACYSPIDYDSDKPYWITDKFFDQAEDFDMFRYDDGGRIREYTDPQQLMQLAQESQVSLYGPSQSKTFYAVAFMEKGTDWRDAEREKVDCMIYYISGNNAPDFIVNALADYYTDDNYYGYYGIMGN